MRNLLCVFISLILLINVGYGLENEFNSYEELHGHPEPMAEEEPVDDYTGPSLDDIKKMYYAAHSNLTVEQLEKGLMYDLKPLAHAYIFAEETYNVNAVIKAAQDALESDWGRNCFATNNISGFFTDAEFWSKEECIYYTASKLEKWYIQPAHEGCNHPNCEVGKFYTGRTIYDVSVNYCPGEDGGVNYEYADKVCEIAYDIWRRALSEE